MPLRQRLRLEGATKKTKKLSTGSKRWSFYENGTILKDLKLPDRRQHSMVGDLWFMGPIDCVVGWIVRVGCIN